MRMAAAGLAFTMILMTLVAVGTVAVSLPVDDGTITVLEVVEKPERFANMDVRIKGFCNVQFEGVHGLYSKDVTNLNADETTPLYAINLEFERGIVPWRVEECLDGEGNFVVVTGIFRVNTGNLFNQASAYLQVERIDLLK